MLLIVFVQCIAFAVLSNIVAVRKGRDGTGWFMIGLLFGIFGFVAALVVSEMPKAQSKEAELGPFDPSEATKQCPRCAELIKAQASVCRYCGEPFTPSDVLTATEAARTAHNLRGAKEWLRSLPLPQSRAILDVMAWEGAERGVMPPFEKESRHLTPEQRRERSQRLKALPDDVWLEIFYLASRDFRDNMA